jgi:histidine triad (HIT) family protein
LVVGIAFGTDVSRLLPIKRVKENEYVLAFWHPKPFWEKHILLVPKKKIKSLTALEVEDLVYVQEIYKMAQDIVVELGWDKTGYTILTNGGDRQDVNQIHFHLNSGSQTNR